MKNRAYGSPEHVQFIHGLVEQFPQLQTGGACLAVDNVRILHARQSEEYLEENHIKHIGIPLNSPDPNPIENV